MSSVLAHGYRVPKAIIGAKSSDSLPQLDPLILDKMIDIYFTNIRNVIKVECEVAVSNSQNGAIGGQGQTLS